MFAPVELFNKSIKPMERAKLLLKQTDYESIGKDCGCSAAFARMVVYGERGTKTDLQKQIITAAKKLADEKFEKLNQA